MQKRFKTFSEYHTTDSDIAVKTLQGEFYRVGLLSESSNDVTFTSTDRNGLVVDLSGTTQHLTHMDGIREEAPTNPGDVFLVPPGLEVRLAWTVKGARQDNVTVEFDTQLFEAYLPELITERVMKGHLLPANYAPRPELASLVGLLAREAAAPTAQSNIYAESVMRVLALNLLQNAWSTSPAAVKPSVTPDPRIHRAVAYIEEFYATDISLLEIARAAGLSPTHLTSLFQRQMGRTPYSHVIERRLQQAVHLLRTTNAPIAQVAFEAGFADQQHMTRIFRSRLKNTPKSVRKSYGGNWQFGNSAPEISNGAGQRARN